MEARVSGGEMRRPKSCGQTWHQAQSSPRSFLPIASSTVLGPWEILSWYVGKRKCLCMQPQLFSYHPRSRQLTLAVTSEAGGRLTRLC